MTEQVKRDPLPTIVTAIDLELAQPSGRIIQIGAAIGDLKTRQLIDSFSVFVNPNEPLSEFIIKLTGITQSEVDQGTTLVDAYRQFKEFVIDKHKSHPMLLEWGQGDCRCLKEQLKNAGSFEWHFGRTSMNVKNIHQFKQIKKAEKLQGGLAKALIRHKMAFKGRKHNARDDAINTLLLFFKMLDE